MLNCTIVGKAIQFMQYQGYITSIQGPVPNDGISVGITLQAVPLGC